MTKDYFRYDVKVQDALRGVVRQVLTEVAEEGLPGEHHFFVSFSTTAPGVRISDRFREQYAEEMTIVLQHQFWGLKINDDDFEVELSFDNISEKLVIPFVAITGFMDPSTQFGLQFDVAGANSDLIAVEEGKSGIPSIAPATGEKPETDQAIVEALEELSRADDSEADAPEKDDEHPAGEIVQLDSFRKKN